MWEYYHNYILIIYCGHDNERVFEFQSQHHQNDFLIWHPIIYLYKWHLVFILNGYCVKYLYTPPISTINNTM